MIIREKSTSVIRKNLLGGKGEVQVESLFSPDEFESDVRFCSRVTLAEGCSIGLHQHIDEDELYFIISGRGIVSDGETVTEVKAGASILTRSGESHSIENCAKEELVMIAVIPKAHAKRID